MRSRLACASFLGLAAAAFACGSGDETSPPAAAPSAPAAAARAPEPKRGLMLALSVFEVTPEGKALPKPGPARLEILRPRGGAFELVVIDDPESNVFHKGMVYAPPGAPPGILTLGGSAAILKLRRPDGASEVLWQKDFGGRFSRMRDAEIGDVYRDGLPTLAVATHDQGVVATVRPKPGGGWDVAELDHEKDTFVHEIELGDLDGDGALEIYATPSEPNRLDGTPQPGAVTRYEPATGEGRSVAADLGMRHAKEIVVRDVDGDGTDELYVSIEGETETQQGGPTRLVNPVEIRRYDAGTDPKGGAVIARLEGERLCRFLSVGDVDGDGRKELVAAGFKTGLWLLRPGSDPRGTWSASSIDRESGGFEHAAILTDLDEDGREELYVASDDHGEVRRYLWRDGRFARDVIYERKFDGRKVPNAAFTWNLMPVPLELIP
jgi:hypothetical protein